MIDFGGARIAEASLTSVKTVIEAFGLVSEGSRIGFDRMPWKHFVLGHP